MSNIINVKEERNVLSFEGDVFDIVANSSNFYLKFSLDEDWSKCSIITVIFNLDGVKYYTELNEDYSCQIPPTNSSKILFCITAEPDKDSKLSSTILSLNVEASGCTCTNDVLVYENAHRNLLGLIGNLQNGIGVNAENSKYAEFAKLAESSQTQVSLTGNESVAGEKNFLDRISFNSNPIPNFSESYNTNLIINGDFQIYQRGTVLKRVGVDTYTADHWLLMNGDGQLKLAESTLTCTDTEGFPSILCQWVETVKQSMWNETVTLSATIDGVRYSGTFTLPKQPKEDFIFNVIVTENFAFRLYEKKVSEIMGVQFVVNPGVTISIHDVKLEFSEYPTKYVERPAYEDLLLCQKYYQLIWVYSWAYYDEASRALYFFVPTAVPPYNGTYCKKTIKLNKSPKFVVDGVEYECKGANYKYKALYPNGVLVTLSVDDLVGTSLEGVVFETGKQYYIYGGNFYLEGEQY